MSLAVGQTGKVVTNQCAYADYITICESIMRQNSFREHIIVDALAIESTQSREFMNRLLCECDIGELIQDDDATRLVFRPGARAASLIGSTREVTITESSPICFGIANRQVTSVFFDGYLYSLICS